MKERLEKAKNGVKTYWNNLEDDWDTFTWKHPGVAGFTEGAMVVYWALVLSCGFMALKGKELGWVDKR